VRASAENRLPRRGSERRQEKRGIQDREHHLHPSFTWNCSEKLTTNPEFPQQVSRITTTGTNVWNEKANPIERGD
jgi:hypothetical protein